MPKIEDKPIDPRRNGRKKVRELVNALQELQVDQSFLWKFQGSDRTVISICQIILQRQFMSRKEGDQWRIGRVL